MSDPAQTWWERVETLTDGEYDIFLAVGSGLTNFEIARRAGKFRSTKTVEGFLSLVRHRLGARSVAQMRAWAGQFWIARQELGLVRTEVPKHWLIGKGK